MNEQSITLDLRKTGFGKRVAIRQNDYHGITLAVDVTDGSKAYSVPAGAKCCLMARLLGSYVRDGGCTVEGGRIVYTADERMFGASGTAEAYFRIEVDGAAYSTEGFQLVVERAADGYAQLSEAYDTEVDRAIKGADDAAAKADDAAEGAKAAGGRADAAAKKAVEAAAKAEAGAGKVDEATDAASAAAKKADTAAQQATAAANKVFPAADNILAGEASGTVAHAEDAFEGGALRGIAVEGAAKQDGIPSPDAPAPIEVIENPVLWVTGRNVFRFKPNLAPNSSNGISFTPLADGGIRVVGTATGTAYYQLDFGPDYYFSIKPFIGQRLFFENRTDFSVGYALIDGSNETLRADESVPPDAVWWRSFLVERPSGQAVDKLVYPNVCIDKLHPYAPNTSQTLTFTLPQEHPYLAKLPDGTADEIVVDEEGNVELVAHVARMKVPDSGFSWNIQEQPGGFSLGYADSRFNIESIKKNLNAAALMCDKFMSKNSWENKPCFGVSGVLWVVPRTNQRDITSEDVAAVANGMVFYAPLVTSVTYPLGKIDMPKAQDSIINAWTDAEVTPNTGIKYVRDVNIVVANLESAIASITEG